MTLVIGSGQVATDIFSRDTGRDISVLKQLREKSDYDDFFIAEKSKAEEQIKTAEKFMDEVKKYIDKTIPARNIDVSIQDAASRRNLNVESKKSGLEKRR